MSEHNHILGIPILNIDAAPDPDYPLRILKAYRENCNLRWASTTNMEPETNPLMITMNDLQDRRAVILDRAIAILEAPIMTPGVSMADPNIAYWQATADKARKDASDNLRLIAEKNIEIADLREQLKAAWAEIKRLRTEALHD